MVSDTSCTSCGLCDLADSVCIRGRLLSGGPAEGSRVKVVVVLSSPSPADDRSGDLLTGAPGERLVDVFKKAGIDQDSVYVTSLVRCIPKDRGKVRPPSKDEVSVCTTKYLHDQIDTYLDDDGVICPMGAEALEYFTGHKQVTKHHGRAYQPTPPIHHTIIPLYNPAYVLYDPSKESSLYSGASYVAEKISGTRSVPHGDYRVLMSMPEVREYFAALNARRLEGNLPIIAVDIETGGPLTDEEQATGAGGIVPWDLKNKILTISLSTAEGSGVCIPYEHQQSPWAADPRAILEIRKMLSSLLSFVPSVGHNYKFDLNWLLTRGFYCGDETWDDTMLMSWILFNDLTPHSLEHLASVHTPLIAHKQEMQEHKLERKTKSFSFCDLGIIAKYNCADTDATLRLYYVFRQMLQDQGLWGVYEELMKRSIGPHVQMEQNGCAIDTKRLRRARVEYTTRAREIEQQFVDWGYADRVESLLELASGKFSLTSTAHLGAMLTRILMIPHIEIAKEAALTATGKISVTKDTLGMFREHYSILSADEPQKEWADHVVMVTDLVLEYKGIQKIITAYINGLPEYIDASGLIHPTFGIRATATGRDNCRSPSLHLIPFSSPVKKMFVSRHPGGVILQADYAQLEMRVLGMITGDEALRTVFHSGTDIHRAIAAQVLRTTPEEVSTADRRRIKAVGFGLLYGCGAENIAGREGVSIEHAQEVIDSFFGAFPSVLEWIREQHEIVDRTGSVKTLHGYRRTIVEPNRGARHRRAQNSPIQGTASDITQGALQRIHDEIRRTGMGSRVINFVHDSLEFDVTPGELLRMAKIMKREMVDAVPAKYEWARALPLAIDLGVGESWGAEVKVESMEGDTLKVAGSFDSFHLLWGQLESWSDKDMPSISAYEESSTQEGVAVKAELIFPPGSGDIDG